MVTMIAAVGERLQLGLRGQLPWHHREDMRFFREVTQGKTLLVGRNTWEGLPPLPGRRLAVLTSQPLEERDTLSRVASLEEGLELLGNLGEEGLVAGGASVYEAFLPHAQELLLSRIPYSGPADTFFPALEDFYRAETLVVGETLLVERWRPLVRSQAL